MVQALKADGATMSDQRPISGSGSCARCDDGLGLASLRRGGIWYCGSACAEGRPSAARREAAVEEPRLYARPARFFGKRRPKELNPGPNRDS